MHNIFETIPGAKNLIVFVKDTLTMNASSYFTASGEDASQGGLAQARLQLGTVNQDPSEMAEREGFIRGREAMELVQAMACVDQEELAALATRLEERQAL